MARTLLSVISGCLALLLAGGGIAFLGWLLWWLWSRQQREEESAPVEIELETPGAERGGVVSVREAELPGPVAERAPAPEPKPQPLLAEPEEAEPFSEPEGGVVDLLDAARLAVVEEVQPPQRIATVDIASPGGGDDLLIIEGIGPRCAGVLRAADIHTFRQLADADVARLEELLRAADPRLLHLCKPDTWPEQAALAAAGDWEAFNALANVLKGGRRV